MNTLVRKAMRFWSELARRKTMRTAIAYLLVLFAFIGPASDILDGLGAPELILRGIICVLLGAFPLVLIASWIFDITPTGLKRTNPIVATGIDDAAEAGPVCMLADARRMTDQELLEQSADAKVMHLHCTFVVMQGGGGTDSCTPARNAGASPDQTVQIENLYDDIKPLLHIVDKHIG